MSPEAKTAIIYGTAWKEERTTDCVAAALRSGFRAIDTANQRKHYCEALVGEAVVKSGIERDKLFLQTKFTSIGGQDHRLPYDPEASLQSQVRQSLTSSLEHLQTDYIDSYVLHGPQSHPGLIDEDWEIWEEMEKLESEGLVRQIGISNVTSSQLHELATKARRKPAVVQNRCLAHQGWDREVRELCRDYRIEYQGFWLLTGNALVLNHPTIRALVESHQRTAPQILYRFALQLGITPLCGTTNEQHMQEALQIDSFSLSELEMKTTCFWPN